jgi:collagen type VII alpha
MAAMPNAPSFGPARVALQVCLLALTVVGCANRGMEAPGPEETGAGGTFGTGGSGTGGVAATGGTGGSSVGGRGGTVATGGRIGTGGITSTGGATGTGGIVVTGTGGIVATGGVTGTGGIVATGGVTGTGGVVATGGVTGTGGIVATGGVTGTGGIVATGGVTGTGGIVATGGVTGTGGVVATGGVTGTGGVVATGGVTGGSGGSAGAAGKAGGTGGAAGAGGKAGAGGNVCTLGGVLDCSSAGALKLPDGQVADFSSAEWNSSTSKWCNPDGLSGSLFSYSAAAPSAATAAVDTSAQNLKLNLTVAAMGYAGGGLIFDSCVNASSFTSIQFTAAITAGSLTGCTWQVQLQTQDQRDSADTNPSGGTCDATTTTCYRYPAVTGLTAPTATAGTYRETFTLFTNPSSSTISTPTQVTGVQWQVNSGSSGAGTCTVELRIDSIIFR